MKKQFFIVMAVLLSLFTFAPRVSQALSIDTIYYVGPASPCVGDTVLLYWRTSGAALIHLTTPYHTVSGIPNGHTRVRLDSVGANVFSVIAYGFTGTHVGPRYFTITASLCHAAVDTFTVSDSTACIDDSVTLSWATSTTINCHLYVGSTMYTVPPVGTKRIVVSSTALSTVTLHAMGSDDSASATVSYRGFHCDSVTATLMGAGSGISCVEDSISLIIHTANATSIVLHTSYGDIYPSPDDTVLVALLSTSSVFTLVASGPYNTITRVYTRMAIHCDTAVVNFFTLAPPAGCIGFDVGTVTWSTTNSTVTTLRYLGTTVTLSASGSILIPFTVSADTLVLVASGPFNIQTRSLVMYGFADTMRFTHVTYPDTACAQTPLVLSWSLNDSATVEAHTTSGVHYPAHATDTMIVLHPLGPDTICLIARGQYAVDTFCFTVWVEPCDTEHLDTTLAVQNSIVQNFEVYPNPVFDYLTVSSKEEIGAIEVSDIVGRKIWSAAFSDKKVIVPTNEWKAGIYFIRFKNGEVKKIQKE